MAEESTLVGAKNPPINTTQPEESLPELYQMQDFDKEAQFKRLYGDNATEKDRKKFEKKYWGKSDAYKQHHQMFVTAERAKYKDALMARHEAIRRRHASAPIDKKSSGPIGLDDVIPTIEGPEFTHTDAPDAQVTALIASRRRERDRVAREAAETEQRQLNRDQESQDWHSHMSSLGYKKVENEDGTTMYKDVNTGIQYYNNGRAFNPTTKNKWGYKWEDLKPKNNSNYKTVEDVFNTGYFRNHYAAPSRGITINGKAYPTVVSTGLYNYATDNVNDRTFAFDPETGKILKLKENWFTGVPKGEAYEGEDWVDIDDFLNKTKFLFRKGGTMKYFQQGGAAPQQDMQQQVVALVQAAMQGDQKATQTVNQIMEAAQKGDPKAVQLAQLIQEVAKQMQGQATAAKWGAKLRYIKSLKYAKGGKACPECTKKAAEGIVINHDKKPLPNTSTSGNNPVMDPTAKAKSIGCGGKAPKKNKSAKKHYFGGWL